MLNQLSLILNYSPLVIVPAVFIWTLFAFWKKKKFFFLVLVMIGFHLGLAAVKTILQYLVWSQSELTRILLNLPLEKIKLNWFGNLPIFTDFSHGYFAYYAWNHFWKEAALSIVAALAVYGAFLLLRKYKSNLFPDGEPEFALVLCLLVGWPQVIMFWPLALALAVIFSIINWFIRRQAACSLFWPLVIAAAAVLVFGSQFEALRFSLLNF